MPFTRSEARRLLRFYNSVSNAERCRIAGAGMLCLKEIFEFPDPDTEIRFRQFSSPHGKLCMGNFPICVQAATKMYKEDRDVFEDVFGTEEAFVDQTRRDYPVRTTTTPRNTPNPATPDPVTPFSGTARRLSDLDLNAMD